MLEGEEEEADATIPVHSSSPIGTEEEDATEGDEGGEKRQGWAASDNARPLSGRPGPRRPGGPAPRRCRRRR
eukprot:3937648-Pyramimonas_sp.AAC.1